jgi:hypothetical protein
MGWPSPSLSLDLPRATKPVVLSREEVRVVFASLGGVPLLEGGSSCGEPEAVKVLDGLTGEGC